MVIHRASRVNDISFTTWIFSPGAVLYVLSAKNLLHEVNFIIDAVLLNFASKLTILFVNLFPGEKRYNE